MVEGPTPDLPIVNMRSKEYKGRDGTTRASIAFIFMTILLGSERMNTHRKRSKKQKQERRGSIK